jgi:outer membrane protein OmpA-like peptidoglycan-associated protein
VEAKASPPAKPVAPLAAAATAAPLPVPKGILAAVEAPAAPKAAALEPLPPLPTPKPAPPAVAPPPPRIDTAALPPGNTADPDCIAATQAAGRQVEVHFARGLAVLDGDGKAVIERLVAELNACPQAVLRVSGHADATGRPRRNLALSQRRARAVAAYLVEKGIDAGRLVAIGYGQTRPVAPNDTRANQAKNRRIEVAVTKRVAPLPPMPIRKQGKEHGLSRR